MVYKIKNSICNSCTTIIEYKKGVAAIVDIGDIEPVKAYLSENKLKVGVLLLTHIHFDHIYGIKEFNELYNVPIYTSRSGIAALNDSKHNFSFFYDQVENISFSSENVKCLTDGEAIPEIIHSRVIATPGHDTTCLSYIIGNYFFTGDSYIPSTKLVAKFPRSDKILAVTSQVRIMELQQEFNLEIISGHFV